jgi:hypothetical protein
MKVLLLGRKNAKHKSGITISCNLIFKSLQEIGDYIEYESISKPLDASINKFDLFYLYGELDQADKRIQEIRKYRGNSVPILLNSTYDKNTKRTSWILGKLNVYNKSFNNLYMSSFSKEVENLEVFKDHKDNIFHVPKLIKNVTQKRKAFSERKDICLGEYNKFMNKRLTGYLNVENIVQEINKNFKDIELWSFLHYDTKPNVIKGLKVAPYDPNLDEWLCNFKIYLTLVDRETFCMVPAEAQGVGTPVFYRNMPQSLNSHIYNTGYLWENVDDLLVAIENIYYNNKNWNIISKQSILNYESRKSEYVKLNLSLQLKKLITRHNRIRR